MEITLRREAVERAYLAHADDVYRVAYAVVRDPEHARDLTQDAFARAFQRWEQYDSMRPVRPWLQGIVSHLALDALRRRHVRRLLTPTGGRDSASGAPDGSGDGSEVWASDDADRAVEREALEDALGGLRPLARAALVLRHVYGYEYAEIGQLLGTSAGNVGSLLTRSHATLRARLSDDAPRPTLHADPVSRAAR